VRSDSRSTTTTASDPATVSSTATTTPGGAPDSGAALIVYALALNADGDGPYLVPVARQGVVDTTVASAVEMLLLGLTFTETGHGLSTEIPPGLRAASVTTGEDGVVTVDLPSAFEAGGGTTSMLARLGQLVATVTENPSVTGVRLALDGSPVEVFSGEGIVLDDPMTRASLGDLVSPVAVDTPAWGADVAIPFEVAGSAPDAGSVGWALLDVEGRIVAEGTTAPEAGMFRFEVAPADDVVDPEAPPYQHTLMVWENREGVAFGMMECVLTLRLPG